MKVYNSKEIKHILQCNGYTIVRSRGSHNIWEHNITKRHIALPATNINRMVWQRLVKQFNIDCRF